MRGVCNPDFSYGRGFLGEKEIRRNTQAKIPIKNPKRKSLAHLFLRDETGSKYVGKGAKLIDG